jgi:hypothetical protein
MFPAAEAIAKGGGAIDCTAIDSGQGFPKEYSSRKPPLAFYAFIGAKPSAMSARAISGMVFRHQISCADARIRPSGVL